MAEGSFELTVGATGRKKRTPRPSGAPDSRISTEGAMDFTLKEREKTARFPALSTRTTAAVFAPSFEEKGLTVNAPPLTFAETPLTAAAARSGSDVPDTDVTAVPSDAPSAGVNESSRGGVTSIVKSACAATAWPAQSVAAAERRCVPSAEIGAPPQGTPSSVTTAAGGAAPAPSDTDARGWSARPHRTGVSPGPAAAPGALPGIAPPSRSHASDGDDALIRNERRTRTSCESASVVAAVRVAVPSTEPRSTFGTLHAVPAASRVAVSDWAAPPAGWTSSVTTGRAPPRP